MQIVEVKFKAVGDVGYFDAGNLELKKDDDVIVEDDGIIKYGIVLSTNCKNEEKQYGKVLRLATEKDINQVKHNAKKAEHAMQETKKLVREQGLDMKIVASEYTFDTSKLIISFLSENRVDFRELVKTLAGMFKTRIELRQIGVRDEAKILGGIGPCGRKLCCSNHLCNFEKVSIKMAKNQGLSLNPSGISGVCGRYMCCLAYEDEFYAKTLAKMPKLNSKVSTPDGEGVAVFNNVLKEEVTVKFTGEDGTIKTTDYALGEIKFGANENAK
jgi:cell fate regulator YaaT (PSP1 superfamily)